MAIRSAGSGSVRDRIGTGRRPVAGEIFAARGPLAGVDEAGRGPLAGPVVAAAVILPAPCPLHNLTDSKQLSPEKREELFPLKLKQARAVGVGLVSERLIDQINIRQATLLAMRAAVQNLAVDPEMIAIDGIDTIPGIQIPQKAVVDGDIHIPAISAASIVAKVVRDRLMRKLDGIWPLYEIAQHKGYGTAQHQALIRRFGISPLHRKTFCH